MKVLVTGATGFIGSHVTRMLVEEGRQVRAFVQPGAPLDNIQGLGVEVVTGDLRDADAVLRAVDGCGEVYHLAAIYALWLRRPELMYQVNVGGTRNVLAAAKRAGVRRVVHTSSIAAVGIKPGKAVSDETTAFNQHATANDYVLSKYQSEEVAKQYAAAGLDVVIVNPAFPFGANDIAPTPTGAIIVNMVRAPRNAIMQGGFNAVDVEDCARGHLLAMRHGRTGERYILGNRNMDYREFAELVAGVTGCPPPTIEIPHWVALAAGWVLEALATFVTRKTPLLTYKTVRYSLQYLYFDCTKAVRELGLPQTPAEVSIERAYRWFLEHGKVRPPRYQRALSA